MSAFKDTRAAKMYVDMKDFQFTIIPELQTWSNEKIITEFIKGGIKKIAYLVSTSIFTQISVEQAIDEDKTGEFPYKFFDNEKSAKEWLVKN